MRNQLMKYFLNKEKFKTNPMNINKIREEFSKNSKFFSRKPQKLKTTKILNHYFNGEMISISGIKPKGTLLYMHGGAYTFASVDSHKNYVGSLCTLGECSSLIVEVSLAPEYPFPQALNESLAAYQFLLEQNQDSEKIVLSGDSSGAGLCLSLLQLIRQEKLPMPRAVLLLSPWTNLTCESDSMIINQKRDVMLLKDSLLSWAKMYAGNELLNHPHISPSFASFNGFPEIHIWVSDAEIIFSDSLQIKQNCDQAGVPCHLYIGHDQIHVWPLFTFLLPEARVTLAEMGEKLASFWNQ